MRRIVSIAAAAVLLMSLFGCGKLEDAFNDDSAGVKRINYPASMTDELGHTVTLEKPAERVVVTDYTTLNAALTLGIGGQLVGYNGSDVKGELVYELYPELNEVSDISENGEISIERIMALEPDVVFMPWSQREAAAELFENGIHAFVAFSSNEHPIAYGTALYMMSSLTCENSTTATELGLLHKTMFDNISGYNYQIPFDERKTVLFLDESSLCSAVSSKSNRKINVIIEKSGAINAADAGESDIVTFDGALLSKWNPDVIWIPYFAEYTVEDVMTSESFKNTAAVINGDVYIFPGETEPWYENTEASCLGGYWALYNLYPEMYSLDSLIAAADSYYNEVYGKSFTTEMLEIK